MTMIWISIIRVLHYIFKYLQRNATECNVYSIHCWGFPPVVLYLFPFRLVDDGHFVVVGSEVLVIHRGEFGHEPCHIAAGYRTASEEGFGRAFPNLVVVLRGVR